MLVDGSGSGGYLGELWRRLGLAAAAAIRVTRAADSAPPTNSSSRQVGILQAKHKLRCLLSEALALISPGARHPELPGSEATVTGLTASFDSCWFDKLIPSHAYWGTRGKM